MSSQIDEQTWLPWAMLETKFDAGYLKDEGCNKAYKVFLSESAHLQEYTTFLHRGLEYPTRIGGKGLIEMLEDYGRIKLYEMQRQPELLHTLWCQFEQIVSQLKYVISESASPDFRTKGAILDSVMTKYVSQKRAYTHSLLALKKQKPVRGNTSGKCSGEKSTVRSKTSVSGEKPSVVCSNHDPQAFTSNLSSGKPTDQTISPTAMPDERHNHPAFLPNSPVEKQQDTVAPPRSASPDLPSIVTRKRCESTTRQTLPPGADSETTLSKLSNVERLQRQREALIQGMRTGVVQGTRSVLMRNSGQRVVQLSGIARDVAVPSGSRHQKHTSANTAADSGVFVPSSAESRKMEIDEQKSCGDMQTGMEDYCDAAVAMEACVGVDGNEDAQCEHDPESGPQTAPSEGASCSLSPLKTPVKRFLMEENSRDAFRSPRRKSQAPKRRAVGGPVGTDLEVIEETAVPPVSISLPVDQHSSDSSDNLLSMPVLDELINSRLFAERLAENINKVKMSVESNPADKPHPSVASISTGATTTTVSTTTLAPQHGESLTKTLSPTDSVVKVIEETKPSDVVTTVASGPVVSRPAGESLLEEDVTMSDAAVSGIIALTQNDPDFDAIFSNLFGIDFSGTDIMGEMTSPSITCPAVLSTNEVPSGVGLQNDIVTKHDFATGDTGCNVEPLKRKPVEFSCTQNTNASLANLETTSNVPTNQNTSFTENDRNTSNTFSSASQTQNGVEHMNTSQPIHENSCETKVLKQSLVPGSFVQIYHISEDGSTGYFETVQVVSSMGNDVIKVDTPLTSKSKGDGLGDRQSDSVVVDHDANKVTSYSVLRQHDCPVTGTEGSLSSTATGTCSSQHQVADIKSTAVQVTPPVPDQQAMLILPSGETYMLPVGTDIISQLGPDNGKKLQSTSTAHNATTLMNTTCGVPCNLSEIDVVETESISPHVENGQILPYAGENRHSKNSVCERNHSRADDGVQIPGGSTTNSVIIPAAAHNNADEHKTCHSLDAVPHTPPTNQQRNGELTPVTTDETNGDYSFTTIDSQALEALRSYDSASPSPAKVMPKARTRRIMTGGRSRAGIQSQTVRTLASGSPSANTNAPAIKSGLAPLRPVTTCPRTGPFLKKMVPFRSTVLSRESWQAKIHDGHWTLVNERKEKRKYLGVPNKCSSQVNTTVATVTPAAIPTEQWQCLSQNGIVLPKSASQQISGNLVGTFSATVGGLTIGKNSVCCESHATGFHIQNGVTTVSYSQMTAGEKHESPLSFGDAMLCAGGVLDASRSPLEMRGMFETVSKVASNTAAIKVTTDGSCKSEMHAVLDIMSPKFKGTSTSQRDNNDVTQVAWSVASPDASGHVRALNFDLGMPHLCKANIASGEDRTANTSTSHMTDASQQVLDCVRPQVRELIHKLTNGISAITCGTGKGTSHLGVRVTNHCEGLMSTSMSAPICNQQSMKRRQETQSFQSVTSKTCVLSTSTGESKTNCDPRNDHTTRQTAVSVCTKDGVANIKPRNACQRPARRVAMKTIKRADEMLAERSLARNTTQVALSTRHKWCDTSNERQTNKCVVRKVPKTDEAVKQVASSNNSSATYKSNYPIRPSCASSVITNGFTTVCESEVAEALVAFATSVVITPVKNAPKGVCTRPAKSTPCNMDNVTDRVAVKCSTPLGQPPPLSSTVSPVSVQCKLNVATSHGLQQTPSTDGVGGGVLQQPPSCATPTGGKRTLDVEDQHSVKPKRTRSKKRQKSLANMDVDKFLSRLHAK